MKDYCQCEKIINRIREKLAREFFDIDIRKSIQFVQNKDLENFDKILNEILEEEKLNCKNLCGKTRN